MGSVPQPEDLPLSETDNRPSRKEDALAPRRLRLIVATAAVTAAAALLGAAPAGAAVHVDLRVEAPAERLFQGTVVPVTGTLRDAEGVAHTTATPTPLGALVRFSRLRDTPLGLTWFDCCGGGWSGFFADSVGDLAGDATHFWALKVNQRLANVGAGAITAREGQRLLFYYTSFTPAGATLPTLGLALSGTRTTVGGRIRVTVQSFDDAGRRRPAVGATVYAGARRLRTDATGRVTVSFPTAGRKTISATLPGAIRSRTAWVSVTPS